MTMETMVSIVMVSIVILTNLVKIHGCCDMWPLSF